MSPSGERNKWHIEKKETLMDRQKGVMKENVKERRGKKEHRRRHKKAKREKKAASARNVSCHCVKYQEGGKKEGWTGGERIEQREKRQFK